MSDLFLIRDVVLMYKCMSNLAPDYLTCLFKNRSSIHQHNTRNSKNLDIPKCRTAKGGFPPSRNFYVRTDVNFKLAFQTLNNQKFGFIKRFHKS